MDVTLDTVGDSISLEFLLALLPFMSLVQDLDLPQSIKVLLVNSGCYPGYTRRFYFLGVFSGFATLHVFVWYKTWIFTQYNRWSYLSTVDVTLDTVGARLYFLGVSSSLVTLHVFVWYKTWIFTQYISGLTCQQ